MYIDESYLCDRDFLDECKNCKYRWIIWVDEAGTDDVLVFCFSTKQQAKEAYDDMEKHNFAAGRILVPHSAILFSPKTAEVIDTCD